LTVDTVNVSLFTVSKKTEHELIDDVRERLRTAFAEVPADEISAAVDRAHIRFQHSTIRDFVPLLVERRASAELTVAAARQLAYTG
jgi:hypothetical protein